MASTREAVVPVVQPRERAGEAKRNGAIAERKTRPVLRDIGNVVIAPAVGEAGKPQTQISRPMTRNFLAQQVANARAAAAAAKNSKKPPVDVTNVVIAPKAVLEVAVQKKEDEKQKHAAVINLETPTASEWRKANKHSKSLTSVLTARSKAACGISSESKDSMISDIDESDIDDELAVVEYVEDLYRFYKEDEGCVHDYMSSQPDINAKMRAILVYWLLEVHRKFEIMPESLYLTVNIMDRFLSMTTVPRKELQLVGISAMHIACKYEEIWPPEVNDLMVISDNAYVRNQILLMEKAILGKLGWSLTVPTPYVFLVRYIKASVPSNQEMQNMVFFLAELALMQYSLVITNPPSKLAAAAVYVARCTLMKSPAWTETLKHHTGYSEDELRDCAKLLASFHASASESKLKAVYRKYMNQERGAVALFPPARSLLGEVTTSTVAQLS